MQLECQTIKCGQRSCSPISCWPEVDICPGCTDWNVSHRHWDWDTLIHLRNCLKMEGEETRRLQGSIFCVQGKAKKAMLRAEKAWGTDVQREAGARDSGPTEGPVQHVSWSLMTLQFQFPFLLEWSHTPCPQVVRYLYLSPNSCPF